MDSIREGTANLPMVAIGIDHSADPPAVAFTYRIDLCGASGLSLREYRIRVSDGENDFHRTSVQRLGTEVAVFRRFVADPELGPVNRESGNHSFSAAIKQVDFGRPKCRFVEFDRLCAPAN